MDHVHIHDHSMPGMEHGDHGGGHDGMDMGGKCSMNMLWSVWPFFFEYIDL